MTEDEINALQLGGDCASWGFGDFVLVTDEARVLAAKLKMMQQVRTSDERLKLDRMLMQSSLSNKLSRVT